MIKSLALAAALHALSPPPAGDSVLGSIFVGPVVNVYSGNAMWPDNVKSIIKRDVEDEFRRDAENPEWQALGRECDKQ